MAQIPIERKKGGAGWLPWVLGLLVLLAIGWYFFLRPRGVDQVATGDTTNVPLSPAASATTAPPAGGVNPVIDQFVQFTQQRDTSIESEGQHQYTAEGTRRLAAALDAVAGGTPTIAVYADSMRMAIDRLQQRTGPDMHAADAKAAFSAATSAIATLGEARGKTRDVAPMRAVYNELNPTTPLIQQLPIVDRFFKAAAEALNDFRS